MLPKVPAKTDYLFEGKIVGECCLSLLNVSLALVTCLMMPGFYENQWIFLEISRNFRNKLFDIFWFLIGNFCHYLEC